MNESWIKLFRKFLDWEWFHDDAMVKMWLYLLLMANYEDRKWQGGVVKRGELVTSIPTLMRDLNRTKQQIRTSLLRLVNTKEITLKTTHHYTIITICKYDSYQVFDFGFQPAEQHTDNTPVTHQQHSNNTTIRNKEVKNNIIESTNVASTSARADAGDMADEKIDFNSIKEFFNKSMEGRAIPKIRTEIGDRRKAMLRARIQQYGIDTVYEVISKAAKSSFLNGGGNKGFIANFEWLMRPNNFPKVLDGNYDDRTNNHDGIENIRQKGNVQRRGTDTAAVRTEDYDTSF